MLKKSLKAQKNNKSCDTETEKAPLANIKKTSAKSTGNNTHLPTNAFDDDCQGICEEKDSDCESKCKIIKENLLLKRDNKELKDRLIILKEFLIRSWVTKKKKVWSWKIERNLNEGKFNLDTNLWMQAV